MSLPTSSGHSDVMHLRAKHSALSRYRDADDPDVVEAKRDLRAAKLAAHVRRVLNETPPMTTAQCDAIIAILCPESETV